jgi:hypothetical protein
MPVYVRLPEFTIESQGVGLEARDEEVRMRQQATAVRREQLVEI